MSIIDDLKYIHQKDGSDALGIAGKQWQQLEYRFDVPELSFPVENIVFTGMGGSALAALLSKTWPGYTLPFEVTRGYTLPHHVSSKSLIIACSYSGNTEETLSALAEAERLGAHIVCVSAGGKLAEIAAEKGYVYVELPRVSQPRYAVLYGFKALVTVLERAGLVKEASAEKEIHQAAEFLKGHIGSWSPTIPASKNPAKMLALDILGLSPVVYAGPLMAPAAYKWKISFNENAKNVAWWGEFSEFNHNEFMGWTSHPIDKPYAIIDLRSSFEHERIQKRFDLTAKLLSGRRPAPHTIQAVGETLLEQLLYIMALGDFVSLYLALLNGINPTPVELIEKFKAELAK
jgi:glucose/mannose-6-phosphate isomerase